MHSSCAQERWIWCIRGEGNGTPEPHRCTTATKVSSVAAPMSEAMMISSKRSRMRSGIAGRALLRDAARLLAELLDRVLADARGHVGVDGLQGLAPGGPLVGHHINEGDPAGLLHLGHRLVVFLLGDVVGVGRGVGHRLLEL